MTGPRDKVMVAYPHGPAIDPQFHRNLVHLYVWDAKHDKRVVDGAHFQVHTTNLPHARNQIVREFLALDTCEWLWFVDTDQVFPPDTLDRLLRVADARDRPIVGALVYSYDINNKDQRAWPTVWSWGDKGPQRWSTAPRDRLIRCDATGTGCVLIHRTAFEKVAALEIPGRPGVTFGDTSWPYFQYAEWISPEGKPDVMGEDLTFMARATSAGVPVHVDTSIRVGHIKPVDINERWHLADLPFERRLSETYVVIPVRDRLDLTKRILAQLKEQGGYSAIFIFDNGSDAKTKKWLANQQQAEVFDAAGANIHQMWNAGITEALSRWPKANVAILNNDIELGPQFLEGLVQGLRGPGSSDELVAVAPNYDGRAIDSDVQVVRGICAARYDGTGGFPGFAFMVKGEAFTAGLPMFDEQFAYWYGDNDWLCTLDQLGARYALTRHATVVHLDGGSQTDALFAAELEPKKAADRDKFLAKWQGVELVSA